MKNLKMILHARPMLKSFRVSQILTIAAVAIRLVTQRIFAVKWATVWSIRAAVGETVGSVD